MSDSLDKFSEWRKKIREKAQEFDQQYGISETVSETVKAAEKVAGGVIDIGGKVVETATDTVKSASDTVKDAAKDVTKEVSDRLPDSVTRPLEDVVTTVRDEIKRVDDEHKVTDNLKNAAEKAVKVGTDTLKTGADVAGIASDVVGKAGETIDAVREKAGKYYSKAEDAYNFGAQAAKATGATASGVKRAQEWVVANPGKSAIIGLSLVAGIRLGSAFPDLDRVVFGESRHWLFHNALPTWATKKLTEKFFGYLKEQERLIAEGKLTEAERERVRFQRKVAKLVGAPVLGAFNIALGTKLWAEIFSPGRIVGFPISIILGGNPVLETVWLFGNGMVCIYNGYQLIMFAMKDQEDVQRIVREIKALLPEPKDDDNAKAA